MTTPSLLQAMVEALRLAARMPCENADEPEFLPCIRCVSCDARAAQDAWGKRPRLADVAELQTAVRLALPPGAELASTRVILDALEPLLYGERG